MSNPYFVLLGFCHYLIKKNDIIIYHKKYQQLKRRYEPIDRNFMRRFDLLGAKSHYFDTLLWIKFLAPTYI